MPWRISSRPGGRLPLQDPLFLGILNATPDSFSDGGRYVDPDAALAHGVELVRQGARMLDLGGESTRPGAAPVPEEEEWARLEPLLARLREKLPGISLSVDTRRASVAERALDAGAAVLNDVTGFRDDAMLRLARERDCGLIAMRSRMAGDALSMPPYDGPGETTAERAIAELREVRDLLLGAGIDRERILLDPGFGFGTTAREDAALWEALPELPALLDWPPERICIAISRKRFVAARSGGSVLPPPERDAATARAHGEAAALGFRVFRTHALPAPAIRAAAEADIPAIARVQVASWRAAYRDILPETLLDNLSETERAGLFRSRLMHPQAEDRPLWVMERLGEILGFVACGPCLDHGLDPAATAEVYALYFSPSAWGNGFGRALLAHALGDLREQGFAEAILWVLERNARARRFYESAGWRADGALRTEWQGGIALREVRYRRASLD